MESLEIGGGFLEKSKYIATFISAISNMKKLTSLKIGINCRNDELKADVIVTIFKSGHLENLKELEFSSCRIFGVDDAGGLPPGWKEKEPRYRRYDFI